MLKVNRLNKEVGQNTFNNLDNCMVEIDKLRELFYQTQDESLHKYVNDVQIEVILAKLNEQMVSLLVDKYMPMQNLAKKFRDGTINVNEFYDLYQLLM